jgi:hypothetical protein
MFRISLPVLIFKSNSAYFDENEYHRDIYHSLLKSNVTDILIVPCYSYKNNPYWMLLCFDLFNQFTSSVRFVSVLVTFTLTRGALWLTV